MFFHENTDHDCFSHDLAFFMAILSSEIGKFDVFTRFCPEQRALGGSGQKHVKNTLVLARFLSFLHDFAPNNGPLGARGKNMSKTRPGGCFDGCRLVLSLRPFKNPSRGAVFHRKT